MLKGLEKKGFPLLLLIVFVGISSVSGENSYQGGDGSEESPFQISSAVQMNSIGLNPQDWDKHFILVSDIDLGIYTAAEFNVIGTDQANVFSGSFDGDGLEIHNFSYNSENGVFVGLFGVIDLL